MQYDISVIIPALNEADRLPRALQALNNQTIKDGIEIIVVDNGSSDGTASVARSHGARVLAEPRAGVAWARQAGFIAAHAPLIATTDADSAVPSDWVERIITQFRDQPEILGIGGPVAYEFADPRVREMVNRLIPFLHELDRRFHGGRAHFVGANFAVRKAAFEKTGGFQTELVRGEDMDLAHRLQDQGPVLFLSDLVVQTSDRRFRNEGPQALVKYFQNYLEVTRPHERIRARLEEDIREIRDWFER